MKRSGGGGWAKTGRQTAVGVVLGMVLLWGCRNVYEDPFRDPLTSRPAPTTASAVRIGEQTGDRAQRHRDHGPLQAVAPSTRVDHGPLYFEDPFESRGSEDGQFAWTWEDYFAFAYGDGRWLVNTMFIPLSLMVDPIWSSGYTSGDKVGPSRRVSDGTAPSDWRLPPERPSVAAEGLESQGGAKP